MTDGKHSWDKENGKPENARCRDCQIHRRGRRSDDKERTLLEYSKDGETWSPRRPECPGPSGSMPTREPGRTRNGDQILRARIRGHDGRYFTAGIAFVNKEKGYIKVQMYAQPLDGKWDGVIYLRPATSNGDADAHNRDKEP